MRLDAKLVTDHAQLRQYLVAGAQNYARADKSDPFALGRAFCHIRSGICDPVLDERGDWQDMGYGADLVSRDPEVWNNRRRP